MSDKITVSRWRDQALSPLLLTYHLRTEAEKGAAVSGVDELPPRYRDEVLDPRAAFAADAVMVAEIAGNAVGCVVASPAGEGSVELKRLWVDPACRGRGAAKALVGAALRHAADTGAGSVRLSVWQWRQDAIALYERLGFTHEDSWDDRPGLVCLRRPALDANSRLYVDPDAPGPRYAALLDFGARTGGPVSRRPAARCGSSRASESAVQLARCLRDLPHDEAFRAYERLRRGRVERIIAQAARTNRDKAVGPVGRVLRDALMPLVFKFADPAKFTGPSAVCRCDRPSPGRRSPW